MNPVTAAAVRRYWTGFFNDTAAPEIYTLSLHGPLPNFHKAEGGNPKLAKKTVREYRQILHFLQPASPGWTSTALPVSSLKKTGLEDVWETVLAFKQEMEKVGYWEERRQAQTKEWFRQMIRDRLIDSFFAKPGKKEEVAALEAAVAEGQVTVARAVDQLFPEEH